MKNTIALIIFCLNLVVGFSQNSELIILKGNDTLQSSEFDLLLKTKDGFIKINNSEKILYNELNLKNDEIISVHLIRNKDTLDFFTKKNKKMTFEKKAWQYQSLSLSINNTKENELEFDFELCKNHKFDFVINLNDKDFKRIYSKLILGIENPKGKFDKDLSSKYNIRQKKKEFRKRKRELRKYFRVTEFRTFAYGNNIIFE